MNSAFRGNSANGFGGAVCCFETLTVVGSTFSGNSADYRGGGICNFGMLTLGSSTVSGNDAIWDGGVSNGGKLIFNNSILWRNTDRDMEIRGDTSGSRNLIGIDPKFLRDPSDGGDGWGDDPDTPDIDESANDDYGDLRLTAESPAIDYGDDALAVDPQGNPLATDLDGNPRNSGGSPVDVGAYEFQDAIAAGRETVSLVVNTADDVFDLYDDRVALREAIFYAGSASLGTTVTFDPALDEAEITLGGTSLWIDKQLTVDASSLTSVTIDANEDSRVFTVTAVDDDEVILNALTVTGGFSAEGGGAIYTSSSLTVANSVLLGNSADYGGAIYNYDGLLTITDTTLVGNSASHSGGAINKRAGRHSDG